MSIPAVFELKILFSLDLCASLLKQIPIKEYSRACLRQKNEYKVPILL